MNILKSSNRLYNIIKYMFCIIKCNPIYNNVKIIDTVNKKEDAMKYIKNILKNENIIEIKSNNDNLYNTLYKKSAGLYWYLYDDKIYVYKKYTSYLPFTNSYKLTTIYSICNYNNNTEIKKETKIRSSALLSQIISFDTKKMKKTKKVIKVNNKSNSLLDELIKNISFKERREQINGNESSDSLSNIEDWSE